MKKNSLKTKKIGIVGVGMVGGALKRYFEKKGIKPFLYDKNKKLGSPDEVNLADIIFICVPTPFDKKKGFDLSYVKEAISNIKGKKIIVIKSTVIPGTTEKLQKEFPQHTFLFNPEFLREKDPWKTFIKGDLQIVGYTKKSKNLSKKILELLPQGKNFTGIMPAVAAELIKQAVNSFLAIKVIFANQIYELARKIKVDYNLVRQSLENESRLGKTHFDVFYGNYQGFGGKCLPKDISALIFFYKKLKLKPDLFTTVWKINFQYLKKQKLLKRLYQDWLKNKS